MPEPAAAFGRYEFVVKGSAYLNGSRLGPETVRFVQNTEPIAALWSGPEGATFGWLPNRHKTLRPKPDPQLAAVSLNVRAAGSGGLRIAVCLALKGTARCGTV